VGFIGSLLTDRQRESYPLMPTSANSCWVLYVRSNDRKDLKDRKDRNDLKDSSVALVLQVLQVV